MLVLDLFFRRRLIIVNIEKGLILPGVEYVEAMVKVENSFGSARTYCLSCNSLQYVFVHPNCVKASQFNTPKKRA